MYMGRNASTTKTMHGSKSIWVHRALNEIRPNKSARSLFKKRIIDANFWGANLTSVLFKLPFASLTLLRKSQCDLESFKFWICKICHQKQDIDNGFTQLEMFSSQCHYCTGSRWNSLISHQSESKWTTLRFFTSKTWQQWDPFGFTLILHLERRGEFLWINIINCKYGQDYTAWRCHNCRYLGDFLIFFFAFFCTFIPSTTVCTVPFC